MLVLHFDTDDGGSKFLRNVGELAPDYKASHPRSGNILHTHRCKNINCNSSLHLFLGHGWVTRTCQPLVTVTIAIMQFPMAGAHKLDDLLGESGRDFTHNLNGL
jgi:hypothetical protein